MRGLSASHVLGLCLIWVMALASPAYAETKQAAFVLDANTGRVLHEQFADAPRKPASLTKMMTLYMAFSEIEAGRLSYKSKIRISERAAGMAPSKLGLKPGEEIELIDAMKALVVKSANDVAVAVAEQIGGTEVEFARLMTARARQIGLRGTRFMNASGLPNSRQVSTARDMVMLGLRLQEDFPQHYSLFATTSFTFRGKTYRTHNTLMHGFPGMDGIKTGYTRASGFNLVSSVKAENKHVIAAVFGGTTAATRNAHMRVLLFRGLEAASAVKTRQSNPMLVAKAAPTRAARAEPKPQLKTQTEPQAPEAWKVETVVAPAPRPVPRPERKPEPKASPAAAAPRPQQPSSEPQKDQIAAVLAKVQSEGSSSAGTPNQSNLPETATPRLDLGALRQAMSGEPSEPSAPETMPEPTGIAALIALAPIEPASAAPPTTQATPVEPAPTPTFARATTTPGPPVLAPSPGPAASGYEIQIGAFGSAVEAETKLSVARARVPLLHQHEGILIPLKKGERQIFRARFLRFDEQGAARACEALRRASIDCFTMKSG